MSRELQDLRSHEYLARELDVARARVAELEAENERLREFIAHTLDEYGARMPTQWKAHARAALAADEARFQTVSEDDLRKMGLPVEVPPEVVDALAEPAQAGETRTFANPESDRRRRQAEETEDEHDARIVRERDAADTGERITLGQLIEDHLAAEPDHTEEQT